MNSATPRELLIDGARGAAPVSEGRALGYRGGRLRSVPPSGIDGNRDPAADEPRSNLGRSNLVTVDEPAISLAERIVPPVVKLPRRSQGSHLRALQQWEGIVLEVADGDFTARLYDRATPHTPEEAEFPLEDVADGDLGLVVPGGVFYWTIGYLTSRAGQRARISTLRFRRLPVWTEQELREAGARAREISAELEWR